MAKNYNITMKQDNGTDYDNLYPKTISSQVLLSKQARDDLNLAEGATATDAVNSIQKDGGAFQVGDTLTTARTDLGNKWLLCNGANEDTTSYPDLSKLFPVVAKRGNDITPTTTLNNVFINDKIDGKYIMKYPRVNIGAGSAYGNVTNSLENYVTATQIGTANIGRVAWIPELNKWAASKSTYRGYNQKTALYDTLDGTAEYVGEASGTSFKTALVSYIYRNGVLFEYQANQYESTSDVYYGWGSMNVSDWSGAGKTASTTIHGGTNATFNQLANVVYANNMWCVTNSIQNNATYSKIGLLKANGSLATFPTLTSLGCIASNTNTIFAFYNEALHWTKDGDNWTDVGGMTFPVSTFLQVNTAIDATDNYCFCWVFNNNVGTVYRLTDDFKTAVKCFDTPSGVNVNNIIIEEANNRVLYWMSNGTWLVSDLGSQFTLPTVSLSDNTYTYIKALK